MSEKIITLNDREQCRQKLPVYFGSNDNYLHAVRECIINARDILKKQDIGKINVTLFDDCRTISIQDNGKGMNIIGETDGVPNWKLLFLTLFSGTKMEAGEDDGGTNGCGNTIICYTSDYFQANVKKDGYEYQITFEDGGSITEPFHCLGKTDKQGTTITFKLSDEVYTNTIFNPDDIKFIIEKVCATLYNTVITFIHKDEIKTFKYTDLEDYYNHNSINNFLEDNIKIPKKLFETENLKSKIKIEKTEPEIVFNFSDDPINHSFLNGIYLPEKGTIHDGIIEGFKKQFHKFIKEQGLYEKKEKNISNQDIEQNLSYAATVSSSHVSYSNQTKFGTKKELYKEIIQEYISNFLEIYFIENKEDALSIANKLLISKRANETFENKRKEIRKVLEEKVTNMSNRPNKFVPCRCKDPKKIEFIVIEGDGALDSIKLARDSLYMCIFPLKGKPINPFKCTLDELISNEEVKSMFKILGCGMIYDGKNIKGIPVFNINNLQVDKLLIATDFDFDGFHIQSLLIGIIYKLAPELLKQGKIYILYTPLYIIKINKKIKYKGEFTKELLAYSENERNEIINMLHEQNIKFKETRFKGLGGLPVNVMSKSLDPETRILKRVDMKDVEYTKKMLELFLSEEKINERKKFIETNGENYFDLSLLQDC